MVTLLSTGAGVLLSFMAAAISHQLISTVLFLTAVLLFFIIIPLWSIDR